MKPLLRVQNLKVGFSIFDGFMKVLDGISFTVFEGEPVGLVGETGCGKSLTVKTMLRMLPSTAHISGRIFFKGEELLSMDEDRFYRLRGNEIAYIPQEPMNSLNPVFTIKEQMIDHMLFKGLRKVGWNKYYSLRKNKERINKALEKAKEMLEKVQIPDPARVLDSYPYQLSGGMRQRVLIAMALLASPSLLIADEPTTALDVTTQAQIVKLLKERIFNERLATIYITHNLGIARQVARRILVMYAGNIVESAFTEELFREPLHPYTRGLLDAIPKLTKEEVEGIPGRIPDYVNPPSGCRFHQRCPYRMNVCSKVKPELTEVKSGHYVSCHLYEKGKRV